MALVTSSGPLTKYELVIWAGPDIKTHKLLKAPFVTQAAYDAKHGGASGKLGAIIAIVAVVAVVAVLVVVARRKMRKGRAA